ncbi:MAG TPA: hypothetical protein VER33_13085 [Polyangiaceae bacterium]|nr:hypothetical protein [Polyangiaceae bacterium]
MLQTCSSSSRFKPQRPPLWYVSNGDLTVGPVNTDRLTRGVERGRVPDCCHVRAFTGDWRKLEQVREIAALSGGVTSGPSFEQLAEWTRFMQRLRDEDELWHTATWLSMVLTGAETAIFHYAGAQGRTLFTRSIIGPVVNARVGAPLSEYDLVLRSARRGLAVQGGPSGVLENGLAKRLGGNALGGGALAMIPFIAAGQLRAMLELGRPGHAFRRSDLLGVERLVQRGLEARWSELGTRLALAV